MEQLEKFGIKTRLTGFVLPLGYSFHLDGSMMYTTFLALFIAQAYDNTLALTAQVTILLVLMVSSKGIAGVPRSSVVVVAAVLPMFGLPEAGRMSAAKPPKDSEPQPPELPGAIDPRLLLPFPEVARLGSISAAARKLGWTQPALGQQLRRRPVQRRQAGIGRGRRLRFQGPVVGQRLVLGIAAAADQRHAGRQGGPERQTQCRQLRRRRRIAIGGIDGDLLHHAVDLPVVDHELRPIAARPCLLYTSDASTTYTVYIPVVAVSLRQNH